jgi:hypothetical protein
LAAAADETAAENSKSPAIPKSIRKRMACPP